MHLSSLLLNRPIHMVAMVLTVLSFSVQKSSDAYPGGVKTKDKMIQWGQYRSIKGVSAVTLSWDRSELGEGKAAAEQLREYPYNGASSVLLYVQEPASDLFAKDGGQMKEEPLEDLLAAIDAVNAYDMLPIVVAFDPRPACRLASAQAYEKAAETFLKAVGERELWCLFCWSDQASHSQWQEGDHPIDMVAVPPAASKNLLATFPAQVFAAGADSVETNNKLIAPESGIAALVARVEKLRMGKGTVPLKEVPVVEIVEASNLGQEDLEAAIAEVKFERRFKEYPWGYGIRFETPTPAERTNKRDLILARMHETFDRYQKEITGAVPLDSSALLDPKEEEEGFVSLFNGKDLSGWVPVCIPDDFSVSEGAIRTDLKKAGWLRSWEPYGDFVFRAEYWVEDGGNSGIYIHAPLAGRQSRIGFEFQMMGDPPGAPIHETSTASLYDSKAPDGDFFKRNDWNQVEIECQGDHLKVVLNGHTIHDLNYNQVGFLKNRSRRGYIGLQDHFNAAKWRNLRIKPMD